MDANALLIFFSQLTALAIVLVVVACVGTGLGLGVGYIAGWAQYTRGYARRVEEQAELITLAANVSKMTDAKLWEMINRYGETSERGKLCIAEFKKRPDLFQQHEPEEQHEPHEGARTKRLST